MARSYNPCHLPRKRTKNPTDVGIFELFCAHVQDDNYSKFNSRNETDGPRMSAITSCPTGLKFRLSESIPQQTIRELKITANMIPVL